MSLGCSCVCLYVCERKIVREQWKAKVRKTLIEKEMFFFPFTSLNHSRLLLACVLLCKVWCTTLGIWDTRTLNQGCRNYATLQGTNSRLPPVCMCVCLWVSDRQRPFAIFSPLVDSRPTVIGYQPRTEKGSARETLNEKWMKMKNECWWERGQDYGTEGEEEEGRRRKGRVV